MLITSNVFNRIDWSVNGVECRTGCYIQNIDLGFIKTNFMNEPDFVPVIRFNQYDNSDEGFGTGWNLNLSCIKSINNRRLLRLGNGSVYWVKEQSLPVPASGRTLELEDQYCKTFYCTEYPDNLISVFYKNGIREDIQRGKLSSVFYPNGYNLYFHYQDGNLSSIYDSVRGTLLSVSYDKRDADKIIVSVMNQFRTDYYHIVKNKEDIYELNSVLTTSDSEGKTLPLYDFQYQTYNNNYLIINSVTSLQDDNRKEIIRYRNLVCPAGLSEQIKGVSEQDVYNGTTDDSKTYYTVKYNMSDDHNFLGAGRQGVTAWQYGKDNLVSLEEYVFDCIVKKGNKLITYIYNNNYLMKREEVTFSGVDKNKRKKVILYSYAKADNVGNTSFLFYLPAKKEEYYEDIKEKSDSAVTEYHHDQYGNLLEEIDSSGIKTTYVYYNGKTEYPGECPVDIYGFDNYLKEKTVLPAKDDVFYDKKEYFYYNRLPGTSLIKKNKHIFSFIDRTKNKENIYETIEYSYYSNDGINDNIFRYGMISEEVSSFFSHTPESSDKIRSEVIDHTVLIDKEKRIVHSVTKLSSGDFKDVVIGEKWLDLMSGYLTEEKKEDSTVIKYSYDNLGRMKESKRLLPGDKTEYKSEYKYDSVAGVVSCTEYDRPNITRMMRYDRFGKLVSIRLKFKNGSVIEKEINKYDRLGRVIKHVDFDYLFNKSTKKYDLCSEKERSYTWDFNDNMTSFTGNYFSGEKIDYLHTKRSKVIRSNDGKKTEVVTDSAGRIVQEKTTLNDNVIKKVYYYDGYSQCSKQITTDSHGYSVTKEWMYDIRGWISEEKISADNSILIQKYYYDERFRDKKLTVHRLNNRLVEVNDYDVLGRIISEEKNQVKKVLTYNSFLPSTQSDTEKTEQGRGWKYTQISSGKVKYKSKTLITPSLPHYSWRKNFNYDNVLGLLNNAGSAFVFNDSNYRYTLKESIKYSGPFFNVGSNKVEYLCNNKESTKVDSVTLKYKFSTGRRIFNVVNDKYQEVYQYKKEGGQLQEVWYVFNKKTQLHCLLKYDKNNHLSDIFIDTRIIGSKKNKKYLFACLRHHYEYDECGRVREVLFSSDDATESTDTSRQTINWDILLKTNFTYDSQNNITKDSVSLFIPANDSRHERVNSERNYEALRSFNGFGELTDCKYSGDLLLTNNMNRILSGQSHKYNEDGLIILSTRRFSSGVSDMISYDYNDKSATLNTLTHCPFKAGWPETEKYAWNMEGMLISRIRSDGYKEEYEYGGEQNVVRMTITAPDDVKTIKTFLYDCHGHLVIQIIQSPPVYPGGPAVFRQIHDIYSHDQLMVRKFFDQEVVNTSVTAEETHYYHRLQNQVIAVSVQDKTGNIKTHFNFNRPDGTTICRCSPAGQVRKLKPDVFSYRLTMQWIAQDQQGLFYQPEIIELQQTCFGMVLTPPKA